MPIDNVTRFIEHTGNAATVLFPFPFRIFAKADLVVTVDGAAQTLDVDYTVTLGDPGGSVQFVAPPAAGADILIERDIAMERETDYADSGPFRAETVDRDMDRITAQLQDRAEELGRALRLPRGTGASPNLPAPVPGKALRWNDAGDGLENTADDIDDLATAAAGSAGEAAASAQQAATTKQDIIDLYGSAEALHEAELATAADRVATGLDVLAAQAAKQGAEDAAGAAEGFAASAEANAQAAIEGQASGVIGYPDKATMDADLTPPDNAVALVSNDPTPANNGWWVKDGASGAGSWVQSSYDRVALVETTANSNKAVIDDKLLKLRYPYLQDPSAQTAAELNSLAFISGLSIAGSTDDADWTIKGVGFSGSYLYFILKKSTYVGDYVNKSFTFDPAQDEEKVYEISASEGEYIKIYYNPSKAIALLNNRAIPVAETVLNESAKKELSDFIQAETISLSLPGYVDSSVTAGLDYDFAVALKTLMPYLNIKNPVDGYNYRVKGLGFIDATFYLILTVEGVGGDYFNYSSTTLIAPSDTRLKTFEFSMSGGETLTVSLRQDLIGAITNNRIVPIAESAFQDAVIIANAHTDAAIANVQAQLSAATAGSKLLHISFDDFNVALMDLITNETTYTTIFDNTFFNTLKTLNTNYSAVFSLYCFNANTATGYDISNVPVKFKQDFIDSAHFIKFGWHGKDETTNLSSMTFADIQTEYNKFITAITAFAGGSRSLDLIPRLSNFAGTETEVQELLKCSGAIRGLLGSDNDATWSYYLGSSGSADLRRKNIHRDHANELLFINSHKRLESMTSVTDLDTELDTASYAGNMNELIMFTHEGNSGGEGKLDALCQWGVDNGYSFSYPQNWF